MSADIPSPWELFSSMLKIRRVEELLMEEYHPADEMRCPVHFCVGQEAMPAALGLVMNPEDTLFTHYRSHGYFLAKGGSLDAMVAEFYGKDSGSNRGLAGSMELADHAAGHYSGAIVGGPMAIAVGDAFARKYRKSEGLTVTVFGDGSLDEGVSYEAMNLASLYRLPMLFVCEDNGYAAHTGPATRRSGDIENRAKAFGMDYRETDDKDPMALLDAVRDAYQSVADNGPVFLTVNTYRFCAHVGPTPDEALNYRPAEELAAAVADDSLQRLRTDLGEDAGARVATLEEQIAQSVEQAIRKAKSSPFPAKSLLGEAAASNTAAGLIQQVPDLADFSAFTAGQQEAKLEPY